MKIKDCQRIYYQREKIQKIYNKDQIIYEYNPTIISAQLDKRKFLKFARNYTPLSAIKTISFFTEETFLQFDTSNQFGITIKDIGKNNTSVLGCLFQDITAPRDYHIYIIGYGNSVTLPSDMSDFFSYFTGVTDISFNTCTILDNTNPINLSGLFKNCKNLISTDFFTRFNISSIVPSIKEMFYDCQNLININLNNINLNNVTDFTDTFYNCGSLVNFSQNNFLNDVIFNPLKIGSLDLTRTFKGAKIEIDLDFSSTSSTPLTNYYKIEETFVNATLNEVDLSGLTLNYTTSKKDFYYRLFYGASIEDLIFNNCYLGSIDQTNRAMCYNFLNQYETIDNTKIYNLSLKDATLQSAYLESWNQRVELYDYLPWYSITNKINLDNFQIQDKWTSWEDSTTPRIDPPWSPTDEEKSRILDEALEVLCLKSKYYELDHNYNRIYYTNVKELDLSNITFPTVSLFKAYSTIVLNTADQEAMRKYIENNSYAAIAQYEIGRVYSSNIPSSLETLILNNTNITKIYAEKIQLAYCYSYFDVIHRETIDTVQALTRDESTKLKNITLNGLQSTNNDINIYISNNGTLENLTINNIQHINDFWLSYYYRVTDEGYHYSTPYTNHQNYIPYLTISNCSFKVQNDSNIFEKQYDKNNIRFCYFGGVARGRYDLYYCDHLERSIGHINDTTKYDETYFNLNNVTFYKTGNENIDVGLRMYVDHYTLNAINCDALQSDFEFYDFANSDMTIANINSILTSQTITQENLRNSGMFYNCKYLTTLDITNLDTSNITDMSFMFGQCENLTLLDVTNFDTSNVTDMRSMFGSCSNLTLLDVTNFNTSNVTDMSYMFSHCKNLIELDVTNFNTSNVTNMSYMFVYCIGLTSLDLTNFDTSKVTDMSGIFDGLYLTELDLTNFNTSNVTNMESMFYNCKYLTTLDITNFNTSNVTDMSGMFGNCSNLTSLDLTSFDTNNVTDMRSMFSNFSLLGEDAELILSNFNTSNVTRMDNMFRNSNLTSLDLTNFNTSNVTNMESMFANCENLTELDLNNFDTSNVTNMDNMFYHCYSLVTLKVDNFNTYNVVSMNNMFSECHNLITLNLNSFNFENITNMSYMFYKCYSLISLYLDKDYSTKNVTNMSHMFDNCSSLTTLNVYSLNTSKVTDMSYMFYDCSSLPYLFTYWNTSSAVHMRYMFGACADLKTLTINQFNTSNVEDMDYMFYNCASLTSLNVSHFDVRKTAYKYNKSTYSGNYFLIDGKPKYLSYFYNSNIGFEGMFAYCTNLQTVNLFHIDTTLGPVGTKNMFAYCTNLQNIKLNNFHYSNNLVVNNSGDQVNFPVYMTEMFDHCTKLQTIFINHTDDVVPTVTNMCDSFGNISTIEAERMNSYHWNWGTDELIGANGTQTTSDDPVYLRVDLPDRPGLLTYG